MACRRHRPALGVHRGFAFGRQRLIRASVVKHKRGNGIHTVSTRFPHGIHTASTRFPHSIHTVITRLSHGFHTVSTRFPHGYHAVSTRCPHGTASTRFPHGVHTVSTRFPHGFHTASRLHLHLVCMYDATHAPFDQANPPPWLFPSSISAVGQFLVNESAEGEFRLFVKHTTRSKRYRIRTCPDGSCYVLSKSKFKDV